jgi:hypothetical protein
MEDQLFHDDSSEFVVKSVFGESVGACPEDHRPFVELGAFLI